MYVEAMQTAGIGGDETEMHLSQHIIAWMRLNLTQTWNERDNNAPGWWVVPADSIYQLIPSICFAFGTAMMANTFCIMTCSSVGLSDEQNECGGYYRNNAIERQVYQYKLDVPA